MSMEKRALLAFVASILLFLAYDYFYLSPRVKEQRLRRAAAIERQQHAADSLAAVLGTGAGGAETGQTGTPAPGETAGPAGGEAPEREKPAPLAAAAESTLVEAAPAAEFTVVSSLFEITFTTAGGEVVLAKLRKYDTAGEPVELIAHESDFSHAHALTVTLEGTSATLALAGVGFAAYLNGVGEPLQDGARVRVDPSRDMTEIVFRSPQNGVGTIERYYRFFPDRYDFEAGVRFATSTFPSATGVWWGMGPGLRSTEENKQNDYQSFRAAVKLGEDVHRLRPRDFSHTSKEEFAGTLAWTSLQTKYFIAALIPPEPTRATAVITGYKPEHRISTRFMVPAVDNRGRMDNSIKVYMGPLDYKILKRLKVGLQDNIEMGWHLLRPVSWLVLWSVTWTYKFIPNYGLVIIIISVLTKVLFYRLTHKSFKSMKELQELQPRIQALKEKFGDDRQKLSQETMKLYKEAGVNPLGGCLPMLLQMPVFIALFQVLRNTIELRQAPFVGWITDLSQPDVLFRLPMTLPVVGNAFSLLPLIMGATMLAQTKIGGSLTGSPGTQSTPKGFNTMLPIVFTFLFYKMPSGLVIYWIINTVLSVAQQYYINREPDKDDEGGESRTRPAKRAGQKRRARKGR
jgi:YidC/Oxa1 family membrane protein insertase